MGYYPNNSLKMKLCILGKQMLYKVSWLSFLFSLLLFMLSYLSDCATEWNPVSKLWKVDHGAER